MSKREIIGKAAVKLDDLLTKCEIHQFVPITDPTNPRKNTGAKIEVFIKLKVPLLKADIVKTSQKWLEIAFGDSAFHSSPQIPTPVLTSSPENQKPSISAPNQNISGATTSINVIGKIVSEAPPKASLLANAEEDIQDLEHSFLRYFIFVAYF